MKKVLYLLFAMLVGFSACSGKDGPVDEPSNQTPETPETPENPGSNHSTGKTLIVYYSFTNNVHRIVTELSTQIKADVIRVQPAEKGLDYAANNYAIGSALIQAIRDNPGSASSYPAIDPVDVKIQEYDAIIVATPLWWGNMAAPMQAFLFSHGADMSGKRIGLIVSSASSGISGVEADAKRLIPNGNFLTPNLWIRASQISSCHSMIAQWLKDTGYSN